MLAQDQSTDYSSELELEGFNLKESSSTQDTSVLTITQRSKTSDNVVDKQVRQRDEEKEEELTEKHHDTRKHHSTREELIKWAAKLELESLSIKEMMKGDMRYLLNQNYEFLITSYKETNKRLKELEKGVTDVAEAQRRNNNNNNNNKIYEGVTQVIADKVVPEIANKMIPEIADKVILKIADNLENQVQKCLKQIYSRIEGIEKNIGKSRKDQDVMVKSIVKIEHKITDYINRNGMDSKSIDSHFSNSHQSLADIKQYLKLLLPKLVSMEKTFHHLASSYTDICNSLKLTTEESNAEQYYAETNIAFDKFIKKNSTKKRKMA